MLLIFFAITWCVLAESPSQLLLLAVAILLRVLYVTGKRPTISRDVIFFWLLIAILGYFLAPTQSKGQVLMWVCKLTLLAPLILHVGHQTASSGVVQRIPFLQSIALFFSRYLVLGRREVDDMLFWSRQNLRVVSARNAHRVFPIRVSIYSFAYANSRLKIATGLLHNARALIDRWDAILTARGGLPKYELSVLSAKRAPRSWYADGIADIGLSILIFLPLGMGNDVLIPRQIIDIARKLNGYALS